MIGAMVAALSLFTANATALAAEAYPTKPVRFILPFPAGGPTDILGRIIGQKLAEQLGQPVVPENRAGAGGNIGIEYTAKTKPDGYTMVLVSPTVAISPALYPKLGYDPVKDFTPITSVSELPYMLLVKPSLPFKNLKELVEYAKANPGKLKYGSGGIGTTNHLACELLKSQTKINIVHVPYKGSNQAMIGVMSGDVDMVVTGIASSLSQIKTGKVKALTVLTENRVPSLPDVPTARESGIDAFEITVWYGILAPAGTPRDIVLRLNSEWGKAAGTADTKQKMDAAGFETLSSTPEQFGDFIKREIVRWGTVIKEANITVE